MQKIDFLSLHQNAGRVFYHQINTLFQDNQSTVGIRNPDMSGFRMVDLGLVFEWSGFRMVQKQDGRQTISLDRFLHKEKKVCIYKTV